MSSEVPTARTARLRLWMAQRSSRNRSPIDKICRWMIDRAVRPREDVDFMRDELIDNDLGFDADELERYQHGETN